MTNYLSLDSVCMSEPRIEWIKKQLEALLQIVDLEQDGKPVDIDGFRLKNLEHWIIDAPNENAWVQLLLEECTAPCNAHCAFCYLDGTPNGVFVNCNKFRDVKELKTKLKYYTKVPGKMIFPRFVNVEENFRHPHIFEMMEEVRKRTNHPIQIITNGRLLDEDMVRKLSKFQPSECDNSLKPL